MAKTLKVTLVKSTIGAVPKNKATVIAMGLTKLHKTLLRLKKALLPAKNFLVKQHCLKILCLNFVLEVQE